MRKSGLFVLVLLSVTAASAAVVPKAQKAQLHSRPVAWGSALSASQPAPTTVQGEWTADARNTWRDNDNEPRVQFNLRSSAGDSRWGFGVRMRDLTGLPAAAFSSVANDVQFSWTKEAGTFRFSGSFDDGRGSGTYAFAADRSFVSNMASLGYRNLSSDVIVRMAVIDVTTKHVRGLAQAGYANLTLDDIIKTRIHRVTPEFIRDLASLGHKGLPIEELVKFSIHRVTPEFIRSMKDAGFQTITEDQLVRLRIHKVDALFIRHAREDGFALQTPADAVDLAIHGPRRRRGF